jgi:hypothetical protein
VLSSERDMERGLLAEFTSGAQCAEAIAKLRSQGYRRLDAYTPRPVFEVESALELGRSPLPRWVLAAAMTGATLAYLVLFWTQSVDYPLNVGSRPTHAAPAFLPITFESGVLFGALASFFGALFLARLPRFWRPLFEVEGFDRASSDRYFVGLDSSDSRYDAERSRSDFEALHPLRVVAVGEDEP